MPISAHATLRAVRRLLLSLLALACAGTITELWLMGHHEDAWQWAPLGVMAITAAGALWVLVGPSRASVRTLQVLLTGLIVTGAIGAVLHYRANMEFQLEMDPSLAGVALMTKILHAKAPPSLAPGNMALIGLMGLAAVWRWDWSSSDE